MSDRAALLSAIRAHPAEDTPRLAFADWLDEHADAGPNPGATARWAAFIRRDIAADGLDGYDPARLRWGLIEKPDSLAEPWVDAVLPPGVRRARLLDRPLLKRGFPWGAACTPDEFLADDEPFASLPVTTIALALPPAAPEALFRSPRFARVTGLRLRDTHLWPRQLRTLSVSAHAEALEDLGAAGGALTQAAVAELVMLPLFARLARLDLTGGRGYGVALAAHLPPDPGAMRLRELGLAESGLGGPHAVRLLEWPGARELERLSLASCPLSALGHEALVRADLPTLRDLDLSNTGPGAAGFRALSTAPVLRGLRRLVCRRNNLNAALLAEFATCHEADALRELDLAGNAIGNAGAAALARSPHLANLRVLDLSACMVGDEGAAALLESPLAESLVLLDLRISPASAEMKLALKARMGDRVRV